MPSSALGITSISPSSGPASGGTVVSIVGYGFRKSTGIKFGGIVSPKIVFINSTLINATTPKMSPGTVSVSVISSNRRTTISSEQSSTLANSFTFISSPAITSVTPSTGTAAGGTLVSISGSGLVFGSTVKFGDTTAVIADSSYAPSLLIVVSPVAAVGPIDIKVITLDGQIATAPAAFTYTGGGLSVDSVSPVSGTADGGTVVTVFGSGFVSGATVDFGVSAGTGVAFVSSTQLQVTSPAHATGAVDVKVTNPDTSNATLTGGFTYIASTLIFSDDFSDNFNKWDLLHGGTNLGIVTTPVYNGGRSAHMHYEKCGDSANPACGVAHQDVNVYLGKYFNAANGFPNGLEHFFIRGHVYFHVNAGGTPLAGIGRKLFYLSSSGANPIATCGTTIGESSGLQYRAFALSISTGYGGTFCGLTTIATAGAATCSSLVGSLRTTTLYRWEEDAWYYIEMEIKLNTPAASGPYDGEMRYWAQKIGVDPDPILLGEATGVNLRGANTGGVVNILVGMQADRQNWQAIDEERYWGGIAIATSGPIGP